MAKVNFGAGITANAAVAVNKEVVEMHPRHNLWCDGVYVTTVRAETFGDACKLAAVDHPGKTFSGPPLDTSKLKRVMHGQQATLRKNIFVMKDGRLEYFTTELAATHADAKAQAQAKHPNVELFCEEDL
jgi:hypothetical protein